MSKSWEGGSTRAWRKLRLRVLQRDEFRCKLGLADCTGDATHVHHTIGKRYGDNPEYLVASCATCNLKVGNPEGRSAKPVKAGRVTEWDVAHIFGP